MGRTGRRSRLAPVRRGARARLRRDELEHVPGQPVHDGRRRRHLQVRVDGCRGRRGARGRGRAQPPRDRARRAARLLCTQHLAGRRNQPSGPGELPAAVRPRCRLPAPDPRRAARRMAAVHRAQAVRARVLLHRRLGLGLVAAARAGRGEAGPLPRRPRSPPPEHEHRAGRLTTRDDRPARRLPLQRLQVRRRRPHGRLDPPLRALPRDARAAGARRRDDASARLHDRPEQQPQGPDRGSDPGHGRDPAHARARCLRRPLRARGGAGRGRPGARGGDPPGRVPRRRQTSRAPKLAATGTALRSTP